MRNAGKQGERNVERGQTWELDFEGIIPPKVYVILEVSNPCVRLLDLEEGRQATGILKNMENPCHGRWTLLFEGEGAEERA